MNAAVLCIGTELTRGEIVNTNATWLADALTDLGAEVTAVDVVDDDPTRIAAALQRLGQNHELVVCTGGLGPTTDDITSASVARLLAVPLRRDEASVGVIRERVERRGRPFTESLAGQADFPEGARVIPNENGTAPGFTVTIERALCFFFPGVPREMKPMFDSAVAPEVRGSLRGALYQVRLKTFGLPEAAVNDRLEGVEAAHDVTLGYRAHFPIIEVKVLARRDHPEAAEAAARAGAGDVAGRLGSVVYAEGDVTLAETVGRTCIERGWMIGTAESCTGGLVAQLLTEREGSSAFFGGAIVSYTNALKSKLLGVDPRAIEAEGAVSRTVARAMAEGARCALDVDVAIALTGVAGPGGGTPDKPVGLVHYAVATPSETRTAQIEQPAARDQVRRLAAFAALDLARELVARQPVTG